MMYHLNLSYNYLNMLIFSSLSKLILYCVIVKNKIKISRCQTKNLLTPELKLISTLTQTFKSVSTNT